MTVYRSEAGGPYTIVVPGNRQVRTAAFSSAPPRWEATSARPGQERPFLGRTLLRVASRRQNGGLGMLCSTSRTRRAWVLHSVLAKTRFRVQRAVPSLIPTRAA